MTPVSYLPRPFTMSLTSKSMRACMVCSIVQSMKQFLNNGCPNCEDILQLKGSNDAIQECTSQVFEGVITLAEPQASWVARWLRLTDYQPGVYAVKVEGSLPEEIIDTLRANKYNWMPRDGSEMDERQEE